MSDAITDDRLYKRLMRLVEKTANAKMLPYPAYWGGDLAGERQVLDDIATGRAHWRQAYDAATDGVKAILSGDREMAEHCAREADALYKATLEKLVRPADIRALGQPAQRRGRPKKSKN